MEKTIEGITFDLKQIKKDIEDCGGKEKFIERAKQLFWTDEKPPINAATQLKRINVLIDAATKK